jgi:glutathione S-transferase
MNAPEVTLVGRSSSHFTRTARMFALDLNVPFAFRPVLDLASVEPAAYADNPALKVPVLVDRAGSLFGTENICRELARRSGLRDRVVLRGDVTDRLVANAEEMIVHAMQNDVSLLVLSMASQSSTPPPKLRRSLENALAYLDAHVDRLVAALPATRVTSFTETALFCLLAHLPFRKLMDVSAYARLGEFSAGFGARPSARATEYRFDSAGS